MIELILYIAIIGLIVWVITKFIPMPEVFRTVIIVIAVIFCILLLLRTAPALGAEPVPDRRATLTWTAPTKYVDDTDISPQDAAFLRYNVYRGSRGTSVQEKTLLVGNLNTLQYVDAGRPPAVEDCYMVTAMFENQPSTEGGPSAEGCKSYPRPAAGAPTLTVE